MLRLYAADLNKAIDSRRVVVKFWIYRVMPSDGYAQETKTRTLLRLRKLRVKIRQIDVVLKSSSLGLSLWSTCLYILMLQEMGT